MRSGLTHVTLGAMDGQAGHHFDGRVFEAEDEVDGLHVIHGVGCGCNEFIRVRPALYGSTGCEQRHKRR